MILEVEDLIDSWTPNKKSDSTIKSLDTEFIRVGIWVWMAKERINNIITSTIDYK